MSCSLQAENCTRCIPPLFLFQNKCYENCPVDGYYRDAATLTCVLCPSHCTACTGPFSSDCLGCKPGTSFYLQPNRLNPLRLGCQYDYCPMTHYRNGATGTCLECTGCASCLIPSICLSCLPNTYLRLGSCLPDCPSGFFTSSKK